MASGTPKVPIVQQNGTPIMSHPSGPQLRPQFRRQGSSFGGAGYVTPMAVMAVPNKVDYSVTKGGLRLWAVLFVFIFLCSSLYALFSTKQFAELAAVDIEEEVDLDLDHELEEEADEVATQNKKSDRDTTASKEDTGHSKVKHDAKKANGDEDVEPANAEDEAEEEENTPKEEEMFAKLKAKAEERSKRRKNVDKPRRDDADKVVEKEEPIKVEERRRRPRRRKAMVAETADEERDEAVDEKEEEKMEEKQEKIEKKTKAKQKCVPLPCIEDENEKEEEKEEKDEIKVEENQESEKEQEHEGEKEEPTEVEEEEEEKDDGKKKRSRRGKTWVKKVQRFGTGTAGQRPAQECKRKNCPQADEGKPRKELLKQKSRKTASRRSKRYVVLEPEEEEEEIQDESTEQEAAEETDGENEDTDLLEDNHEISEAKFQRLQDRSAYKRHAITNREDDRFRTLLDKADSLVEKHNYKTAFALFEKVLEQNEDSPRAHFGRARAFEIRSETEADSSLLDPAINEYQAVLKNEETPDALYRQAATRLIELARFRGTLHKVLLAQRALIDRYPDDPELQNDFGLTFLMMGREDDAFKVYSDVLKLYPENGMAQAYYGFIQKLRGNLEEAVLYMKKGFRAIQRKITDPRFYYHFGDALMRLGKGPDAYEVYNEGAKIGLFLSPYQRSLHNFRGLSAKAWWSAEQSTYAKFLKVLEKQWTVIREESILLLRTHPELFIPENTELTLFGNWSAYHFYRGWSWDETNCRRTPKTCGLLREFRDTSNASKSEMKLSLLTSNSRVWPHCGYSNCRLQAHLGLVVPSEARIRVADETRGWKTGRFIIFDDSFEHELWFEGASANKYCLVLMMDLWHPDVASERRVDLGSL